MMMKKLLVPIVLVFVLIFSGMLVFLYFEQPESIVVEERELIFPPRIQELSNKEMLTKEEFEELKRFHDQESKKRIQRHIDRIENGGLESLSK